MIWSASAKHSCAWSKHFVALYSDAKEHKLRAMSGWFFGRDAFIVLMPSTYIAHASSCRPCDLKRPARLTRHLALQRRRWCACWRLERCRKSAGAKRVENKAMNNLVV
jgi:hypothetical protein